MKNLFLSTWFECVQGLDQYGDPEIWLLCLPSELIAALTQFVERILPLSQSYFALRIRQLRRGLLFLMPNRRLLCRS